MTVWHVTNGWHVMIQSHAIPRHSNTFNRSWGVVAHYCTRHNHQFHGSLRVVARARRARPRATVTHVPYTRGRAHPRPRRWRPRAAIGAARRCRNNATRGVDDALVAPEQLQLCRREQSRAVGRFNRAGR